MTVSRTTRRRRRPRLPASESAFGRAAAPAVFTVERAVRSSPDAPGAGPVTPRAADEGAPDQGTRTPDNRTRVVELTMPTAEVLALARAEGVALTMYLTAVFFESVRRSSGLTRTRTVAASVPVNLRSSPRRSAELLRDHPGGTHLRRRCRRPRLDLPAARQFRPKSTPEALEEKLRRFLRFERMPVLRIVPRPLKDVILKLVNHGSNRSLTIAVSNLGRLSLPEPADSHVGRMLFHVSAARPSSASRPTPICSRSASPRRSPRPTTSGNSPTAQRQRVEVTVAAVRVTETELAERNHEALHRVRRRHRGQLEPLPTVHGPGRRSATASPLPAVPLRFSRRRVLRVLFLASIAVILASFVAACSAEDSRASGPLLGVAGVDHHVAGGVDGRTQTPQRRQRDRVPRRPGQPGLRLLGLPHRLAWLVTDLRVPIVSACSIVALLITVRVMRIEVGEHILYSGLTVLLGLAPIVFLALGWVNNPVPSATCGALSLVTLVLMQLA